MSKRLKRRLWAALALLAALLLTAALLLLPAVRRDIREGSRDAIKDAVIRAAVACYAVEGAYPTSLEYLEEHYGLAINHDDFIVSYDVFASNIVPTVDVLVRGEG